jgi:hypothetical protein
MSWSSSRMPRITNSTESMDRSSNEQVKRMNGRVWWEIKNSLRIELLWYQIVSNSRVFHSRVLDYMNLEEEFGKEKNNKDERRKKARGREQAVAVLFSLLPSLFCRAAFHLHLAMGQVTRPAWTAQ